MVIPFAASSGDHDARKLADSAFSTLYGRLVVSHGGHVGLAYERLPTLDPQVPLERARKNHSKYVLYGGIEIHEGVESLSVKVLSVKEESVLWSKWYPVAGADVTKIAADVESNVPGREGD